MLNEGRSMKAKFLFPAALAILAGSARAEVAEIALAQQYGLAFMPLMLMEREKLIEQEVKARGLPEPQVKWAKVAGPSVMNEMLISGALSFTATGVPSLALLWDKTRTVKGVAAICSYPQILNTRNKAVKTIKDFTEKDKIAVPSVKVSTQAILLQMEAEKIWGVGNHTKLDPLTVSLSHPDAMTALLNNTEVTAHFATSPFHEAEVKAGAHTVLHAYDILGGRSTALVLVTTEKFRKDNPKSYDAVLAALTKAIDRLNADKRKTVELWKEWSGDKQPAEELQAMVEDPGWAYTLTPEKTGKFAEFLNRVGVIKNKPASWKDMFFAEAHSLPGD
jgi:NitT/TauT family transport system substrate-binding protein